MFDFGIVIALECNFIDPKTARLLNCTAEGSFYHGEEMLSLKAGLTSTDGGIFKMSTLQNCIAKESVISSISIYGSIKPTSVTVNEDHLVNSQDVRFDEDNQRLDVANLAMDICDSNREYITLSWE